MSHKILAGIKEIPCKINDDVFIPLFKDFNKLVSEFNKLI